MADQHGKDVMSCMSSCDTDFVPYWKSGTDSDRVPVRQVTSVFAWTRIETERDGLALDDGNTSLRAGFSRPRHILATQLSQQGGHGGHAKRLGEAQLSKIFLLTKIFFGASAANYLRSRTI